MTPETPNARELSRRLVAREAAPGDTPDTGVATARAACERVFRAVSRWFGAHGSHALFTRARAQAQSGHPLLGEIRFRERADPALEGVTESIEAHGAAAVAVGLESLLVALLELLRRLLGEELTARLVEQSVPDRAPDDERRR